MKKVLAILMAMLLCLSAAAPAMAAEGSASLLYSGLDSMQWVSETNVLRLNGSEGYGLAAIDGSALTEAKYNSLQGYYGYITAARVDVSGINCYGVLSASGSTVIPFQYGDMSIESSEWALGIVLDTATGDQYDYKNYDGDQFWLISRVDVYWLPTGQLLASLTRDQFLDADVVNHCLNIQDRVTNVISCYDSTFTQVGTDLKSIYDDSYAPSDYVLYRENGQYGIKDVNGNIILPPSWQYIETPFRRGYAVVDNGSSKGLLRLSDAQLVVPVEFDSIQSGYYQGTDETGSGSSPAAYGYAAVIRDDKLCYYDITNARLSCETSYSKSIVSVNGISATLTDLEGNIRLISADGVETVLDASTDARPLDSGAGMYYRITDANGMYGVIDWHGNTVLPAQYSSISMSENGQYLRAVVDYETMELYQVSYPTPETTADNASATADSQPADATADESGDESPVTVLINNAVALIEMDAVANQDAVIALLNSAISLIGESDPATSTLLNSAITLLEASPADNASSVLLLLKK